MNLSESIPLAGDVRRIFNEYLEMPGMRLTCTQAQRLWDLESARCMEALQLLMDAGFLRCTDGGQYARLTEGPVGTAPLRMVKAQLDRRFPGRLAG